MNDSKMSKRSKRAVMDGVVRVSLVLLASLWLGSCAKSNRISIEEYLASQEQCRQAGTCATQPAVHLAAQTRLVEKNLGAYRVGVGDVLSVTLVTAVDQPAASPPIVVRVDTKGQIMLPQVGNIKVAGLELPQVDEAIRRAYVPAVYRDIAVYVDVPRPESTNVLVTGAVTAPGLIPLRHTERNLLYAIVGAGGVTDVASGTVTLRRLRDPAREITLNLYKPEDLRMALTVPPLETGDMITVQAATPNIVFVGGLVNAPQAQSYPPGTQMTILQALAASGGLRTDIFPHEGLLIHHETDGKDLFVKLNLDRIQNGEDPNLALAAGDILWVPYTWDTRVEDWINQHIYIRGGVAASVNYNVNGIEFMNRQHQQSKALSGGGGATRGYQDTYDPFGFLLRNQALSNLVARPVAAP